MDYKTFFIELLSLFFNRSMNRSEVADKIATTMPVDTSYVSDEELMNNCEWALRHINEPDHYTTEDELAYYLSCLKGDRKYSLEDRDNNL